MQGSARSRRDAVASHLQPIVRIADDPNRWSIDERLSRYGCPGVAIAVLSDGAIDWVDGFGSRTVGAVSEPIGPDTVFLVASCSKPVTATLVAQHADAGLIDLDTDVNVYLRRWKVPENDFTRETPVTLRRILSHTAGLTVNGWGVVVQNEPLPDAFDLLEGRPPSAMPAVRVDKAYDGTSRYSGGGYLVAQLVLEDVTGTDFVELAERGIFGPLGMDRATFARPLPASFLDAVHHDIASGHRDDGTPFPGGWAVPAETAAGGLCCSARDYATFLLGVRNAFVGRPGSILSQSMAREMATIEGNGAFGLGFRVVHDGPRLRLNHGGSNDGYQTETNLFPETGEGAVVFTNSTSGIFLFREVFNSIAEVYEWPDFGPAPKQLVQLDEVARQKYVGTYRIVAGIEMPFLRVWSEGGRLWNEVPGLRFGVQEVFVDTEGVLFNQTGPFESRPSFGPNGRVAELVVLEGSTPVLRAVRSD